ncbi:MAG: DUF4124 domain-containing protein [Candidatus Accumulibacter sp.]|jgi:hypothetical protein|nr:DUF4124 domain-containing protein [Accumulibacter sp.]
MMKLFFKTCAALLATMGIAQADVLYQCVDDLGRKTFSNVKLADKNIKCASMNLGPMTAAPSSPPRRAASPSPSNFPRVGEPDQKARDNDRRRILENELQAERKSLEQAKEDLVGQESIRNGNERNYQKVLDRLEPYKNKVALHERNIEAIENELARLR